MHVSSTSVTCSDACLDEALAPTHRTYVTQRLHMSTTAKRYGLTASRNFRSTVKKFTITNTRVQPSESILCQLVTQYRCPVISDQVPNGTMEWVQIPATDQLHMQK